MPLLPGARLGPYEVTAQIGVGGMGEVYRATDTNLGRQVAIKVLPDAVAQDVERLARFDREARTLAALNHPNIAAIYGLERAPSTGPGQAGTTALVMELVEGLTLADRIVEGPVPVDEALPIAAQIAGALEAAHEQGIIHRDLKPANVKVRPDGTVKVLDFGLAKAMEPAGMLSSSLSMSPTITTPAMTQAGMILGTAAYMSPEQARGRPVDRRADIWAFGCVLYEMLTGHRAFEGEDVADTLGNVMKVEPAWERLPAAVPARVERVVRACLRKPPKERLDSAQAVRLALAGAFDAPTSMPQAVEPGPSAPLWRRMLPAAVSALAVATVLLAAVWAVWPSPPAGPLVRWTHQMAEGSPRNAGRPVLAIAPDASFFVYNAPDGLRLRLLGQLEDRIVPGTDEALTNPFVSPDGQSLGFFSGGQLRRVAVAGGVSTPLAEASNPFDVSWGSDGTVLYGQPDGIWRVSENGGDAARVVATEGTEQAQGPQLLPGGEWVLFSLTSSEGISRWDDARIVVQSLLTGERRVVREGGSSARYLQTGHLVYAFENVLYAVGFDLERLETIGGQAVVLEGVARSPGAADFNTGAAFYAVAEDGTLVYIPGGPPSPESYELALVDEAGSIETLPAAPRNYASPRVSPDGSRIAVEVRGADGSGSHVFLVERGSGVASQFTFDGTENRSPVWTADGRFVLFASDRAGDGWGIYRKAADGTGSPELVVQHTARLAPNDVSRAGVLIYERMGDGPRGIDIDLWTVALDGGEPDTPFLATPTGDRDARFSPDGRWVSYVSGGQGLSGLSSQNVGAVFVRPYPNADETRWRVGQGRNPLWASEQRALSYFSIEDLRQTEVAVGTSPAFSLGVSRSLFAWRPLPERVGDAYDAVPGDGRILFVKVAGAEEVLVSGQVVTVQHWFEELKRLVPVD